jgi:NAD(P)-dependent dehydrogenase (short-subunit alcohol dehydrogenase family)
MKGKTVLITGAASGIGKASAELYGREGANVVLSDINDAESIADKIRVAGGNAIFVKANVANPEEMKYLIDIVIGTYGRLDIAINNAGISGEQNALADMSIEGWENIIKVNLSSVFYCMKYQIQEMLKQGGGSIINVSSILGSVGFAGAVGYTSAKHGLIGMTQVAALEYSGKNIRINAVGPGFIETPMLKDLNDDIKKYLVSLHPIGRLGKSEEVAELILWLSSDKASFVTGSYYPVDGGYLAR